MVQRILSILSWVGVVLVFGALVARLTKPEWDQYATYGAYAGLALVLLYTFGQWREIAAFFRRRNARYGTIAAASVVIVLAILVAINYLSNRRNKRWDLTENKQYSLSEQSNKLLGSLTAPAKFMVFDRANNLERFRPRLESYKYGSRQVDVEYVDVDKDPVKTKEYKVDTYGTIVVEYMGRTERVTADSESDITNALIKVVNPAARKIYFLSGHGEKDPGSSDQRGYSTVAELLKRDNYEFATLPLAQANEIPMDATVLVIAGPRSDLLDQEVPLINNYLTSRSGKLLVLFDPPENLKQPAPTPRLTGLLDEWGIKATDTVVFDVSGYTSNPMAPFLVPPYPAHAITNNFGFTSAFPVARALQPETSPQKRSGQTFLQTGPKSWAETSLASLGDQKAEIKADPAQGDITGPVSIGVATAVPAPAPEPTPAAAANTTKPEDEPKKPETRVAAIGDSDFVSNAYLGVEGNRDLFMNVVNWLAQQENLIAIRPREPSERRMTLTENKTTAMLLLSIFVIPGVVLGAGVYSWWRRR
jgi:ABC-type uncharacterized transport system involved in gliding motility auxiliary subunit